MENQVIVITGAGSGLGASLASRFAKKGARVVLLGRNRQKLEAVAKERVENVAFYELDVRRKQEVTSVFQTIQDELGPIRVLINNAGIGAFGEAEQLSEDAINQMLDTNVKGTIFCTQQVLPHMKARNEGQIVNIISTAGLEGKANESVYCASKFAVRGFTESLQVELRQTGIRVSGVYMGGMDTPFWEGIFTEERTKTMMKPDDVADVIVANMSERPYMNVEELVIRNKK